MYNKNDKEIEKYQLIRLYYGSFNDITVNSNDSYQPQYNLIKLKDDCWVPIITKYGDDIITNEHYYSVTPRVTEKRLFAELEYRPYYCSTKSLFSHEWVTKVNYADYNKIFYSDYVNVLPSEVVKFLKIIQLVGKNAYIKAINKHRAEVMELVYGEEKRKKEFYNNEQLSNNNVKELLKKIK